MTTTLNQSNFSMSKEDKQLSSRSSLKLTVKSILAKDSNIRLGVNLTQARNKRQPNEKLVV
jgi:hypothetical protein